MPSTLQVLRDHGNRFPKKIIEAFVQKSEERSNGRVQDDDVTFVVIKKR